MNNSIISNVFTMGPVALKNVKKISTMSGNSREEGKECRTQMIGKGAVTRCL